MSAPVLLLLALLPAAAALVEDRGLSAPLRAETARLGQSLRRSATYRRLDSSTRHLPRREVDGSGLPGAVDVRGGDAPTLLFDVKRFLALPDAQAVVAWTHALARAELAFPIPVVEAEQAAWQTALRAIVELAVEDEEFSRALERAYREADPARAAAPASPLERAGLYLRLFELDPARFHKTVEDAAARAPGAARLTELEDLFALRGRELAALKAAPAGPYARLGGRRYPGELVRSAWRVRGTGEVERLREALAAFDTVGASELAEAFARWRRAAR